MRISDWSSDVCSSDLALVRIGAVERRLPARGLGPGAVKVAIRPEAIRIARNGSGGILEADVVKATYLGSHMEYTLTTPLEDRSEEHTSELQSLMRISSAVFCLKKKINSPNIQTQHQSSTQPQHTVPLHNIATSTTKHRT